VSSASFYKWRSKYGGMDAAILSEMKAIAEENKRLKRISSYSKMLLNFVFSKVLTTSNLTGALFGTFLLRH